VYTFRKLHYRRIPNDGVGVRVGVGPMEFQLKSVEGRRPLGSLVVAIG